MTTPNYLLDYRRRFKNPWCGTTAVSSVRFVVLDSETTGLDPQRDRIISIGAVAVQGGEIDLADSFGALLKISHNTSAVTVHGITREASQLGREEPEALQAFLCYLQDGVIVGHHIAHDIACLNAGFERHFKFRLENRSLDIMTLTLLLEQAGAFIGREPIQEYSLDSLCDMFHVIPHDRHTASGDAFLTAQIFLRLLKVTERLGWTSLGEVLVLPTDCPLSGS